LDVGRDVQEWCGYTFETRNATGVMNMSLSDSNFTTSMQVNATVPVKPCKFRDRIAFILFYSLYFRWLNWISSTNVTG